MRLNLRKVLFGLIALVVVGWFFTVLNSQNQESADSEALRTGKVTLVIDFGSDSGREPIIREVTGFQGTGWDLFEAAGVKLAGTAEYPTGFVCRINDVPAQAEQDCLDTPKYSEGSWAYFVTNRKIGPGWLLSGSGAQAHRPECGSYEGWLWVAPGKSSGQTVPSVAPHAKPCAASN